METKLPANITEEMVKNAKEKHGQDKIVLAELFVDNESIDPTLVVMVAVPGSRIRNEYIKWVDRNPNKAEEILLKACVLCDLEMVLADDKLRVAAFDAITQLLPTGKAVLKKV